MRTWYPIKHSDGRWSVQDRPNGAGALLGVDFDDRSEHEARLVAAAANAAYSC
jgi:hypothetical protein